jgi:hypothetical protein
MFGELDFGFFPGFVNNSKKSFFLILDLNFNRRWILFFTFHLMLDLLFLHACNEVLLRPPDPNLLFSEATMQTRGSEPGSDHPDLDQRLAALAEQVRGLEARVATLETTAHLDSRATTQEPAEQLPVQEHASLNTVLGLLGRTSLVLAGAFLIRTFTESGSLPRVAGVALGLAYAAAWALAADRAGTGGRRLGAAYHAVASAMIAYPLLWETTTRFPVLAPAAAAGILLGITVLLMSVAWRQALEGIAWTVALAGLCTGFALMAATSAIPVFCTLFLLFAGATLVLGVRPEWRAFRWPAALAADAAILSMIILAASPGGSPVLARNLRTTAVLALALALVAVYLASFVGRALVHPRSVRAFEVAQTLAILPIGFGGALRAAHALGAGTGPLGLAALAMGLGCYVAAFTFVRREAEGSSDFRFLTSLALVLVLVAGPILLPAGWLTLELVLLGLASAALGWRFQRGSLLVHGAIYLTGAALASGLLEQTWRAFLAPSGSSFPRAALLALAALTAGHVTLALRKAPGPGPWSLRLPCFLMGALGLLGLAALAVSAAQALLPEPPSPGALAALRTAVLALAAVAAGALGRWVPTGDLGWLVHPLLGATTVKLLLQDLPQGRPLTLTLALTCFGAALLVAPRLAGRRSQA